MDVSWIHAYFILAQWQGCVEISHTAAVEPSHSCFARSSFPSEQNRGTKQTWNFFGRGNKILSCKTPSLTDIDTFLSRMPLGECVENRIGTMCQLPTESSRERLTWRVNWSAQQFSSSSAKVCSTMSETQQD